MTWIVPSTPVFGRADESVDDAPTHQVEPGEDSLGRVVVGVEEERGVMNETANAAPMNRNTAAVSIAVFNNVVSAYPLNRPYGTTL
jgi:hypothetical protein